MAQKQYTTYQADILSFELRDALLGVINPGRYIGFNDMTEYQAQAGSIIYCRFSHTTYAKKYDKASPPVLEANRGVAISTQGTVIAEDSNVDAAVTIVTHASGAYHLLYMEHEYTEVQGANPATYGIKHGTGGGSAPALDSPTKQVVLGTIEELPNAANFADLVWHPAHPEAGDLNLYNRLFLTSLNGTYDQGDSIPAAGGIIGNRDFSDNNYVTDFGSLTDAIGELDAALKVEADAITALEITKLDDWTTPDDNTDLDATITEHGLLPKLSDDATEFLNGIGAWAVPLAGFIFIGSSAAYHYNSSLRGGSITMGSTYELDISNEVPAGYTQALIVITMQCYWGTGNASGRYGAAIFSRGATDIDRYYMEGPKPLSATALNGAPGYVYQTEQIIVELSSSRVMRITWGNHSGTITDWMYDIQIKVQAYR